jgi:hypothetical protein
MATDPQFASSINLGTALLGAAETNLQAPTTTSVIVTAGANGTKIEELVIAGAPTTLTAATVAGQVYVFLYDGSAYHLYDSILVTAVTPSTTVAPFRVNRFYVNLILKNGWSLRASQSIVGNASLLNVFASGGDL